MAMTYPETSLPTAGPVLACCVSMIRLAEAQQRLTWLRSGQTTSLLTSATEKELVREGLGGIAAGTLA